MTENASNDFTDGPLYAALIRFLPTFVKDLHSETPKLNVGRLHKAVGMSHEGVYKWLRSNKLTPENVTALVTLAGGEANLKVLQSQGVEPPSREDFIPFMFA